MLVQVLVYGFALWFGGYLLARSGGNPGLRYAGLGLVAYGLGIGLDFLSASGAAGEGLPTLRGVLLLIPVLCWLGALWHLYPVLKNPSQRAVGAARLALIATLFFGLSMALVALSLGWLPREVVLLLMGVDVALLGFAIVWLDALDEGEALLPDMLYSLDMAGLLALLFGGQVALVMLISGQDSPPLRVLLLALIATAIIVQTFSRTLQDALDRLIFAHLPHLSRQRAALRAAASALPRVDESLDLLQMDDDEFARLTRRALSHFGDLQRLAASPLTRLPIIDARLAGRGLEANTLERAAELKALLAESITRLKPRHESGFNPADEWRYYNALYFPYVAGLKPYSRRASHDDPDADIQAALVWFQTYVPERTLHNWQNAAARLVAQDLREQLVQV